MAFFVNPYKMTETFTFKEFMAIVESNNAYQNNKTCSYLIIQTTLDNLMNICKIEEPESGLHFMDAPGVSKILDDFFNHKITLENALKSLEESLYKHTIPPHRFLICLLIMGWKLPIYIQCPNKWTKTIRRNVEDYCQISFCLGRITTYYDFPESLKKWSYQKDNNIANKTRFNDIIYQIIQKLRNDLWNEYQVNSCYICYYMYDLLSIIQDWLI